MSTGIDVGGEEREEQRHMHGRANLPSSHGAVAVYNGIALLSGSKGPLRYTGQKYAFSFQCPRHHVTDPQFPMQAGTLILSYSRAERRAGVVCSDGRQQARKYVRDLRGHGKKAKSEEFMIMNICGGRKRQVVSGFGEVTRAKHTDRADVASRPSPFRPFIGDPNSKTVSFSPRDGCRR